MKNLKLYLSLVAFGLLLKVGHTSLVKSGYLFEEFRIYNGELKHSEDGKTLYLYTADETIELEFAFDKAEDLIVEEWGAVDVSGYYSRFHKTLLVEEISGILVTIL